jgi:O-antigen ligase
MLRRAPGLWLALGALTFFPFSLDSFELPHQVVLAAGALVAALVGARRSSGVLVAGAAVLALGVLTTLTSQAPWLSFDALVTLLVVGSFALGAGPLDTRAVLWTTWPIAAWALVQATGHDPVQWADVARWCGGVRPFATLGHPTQLGVWLALVTVLAMERARTTSRGWLVTAALAAFGCVLTLSRAGWLALAVGVVTWVALRRGASARGRSPVVLGAGLTLVGAAALVLGPAALAERLTHFFTAPTRVQLWGTAWQGFTAHPWLGWGLDTFTLVDQQFRHPDAWRYEWGGTAAHAHSLLPNVAATQGVLGLAVFAGLGAWVVRRWVRLPAEERDPGAIAVVVALAAASMVAFSGVLVSALGLWALVSSVERANAPNGVSVPWVAPFAGLAVSALMLGASMAAHVGLTRPGDVPYAQRWLKTAHQLQPWSALWPTRLGALRESSGDLVGAREAYEAGAVVAPGLAIYEANVGRAASEAGDAQASRDWFERARRHAPLDARIALEAARASERVGDLPIADATLTHTLGLYPTDGPAWLALASVRLHQGRGVEARAALEASLQADWRDWPEGPQVAQQALATVLSATGDDALAHEVSRAAASWTAPAEICGAPALLAR